MKGNFYNKDGAKLLSVPVLTAPTIPDPPTGTIVAFVGSLAPENWLLCQGQEVPVASYSELNEVIGTTYGSLTNGSGGAGTSHFRVPNLSGKLPVGAGAGSGNGSAGSGLISGGSALTSRSIGSTAGSETVTLTGAETGVAAHSHPVTETNHSHTRTSDGSHTHSLTAYLGRRKVTNAGANASQTNAMLPGQSAATSATTQLTSAGFTVGTATSTITVGNSTAASASSSHTNIQPGIIVNYIIKT